MNAMSDLKIKSPPRTDTPPNTPAKQQRSAERRDEKQSPRVRQKSGNPDKKLLSPSSAQASCIPLASPRVKRPATDSPYKSPPSRTGASEANAASSLRGYLQGLKPDNLVNGIFRDQTKANAATFPTGWLSLLQASLEGSVGKLAALAPKILEAMPNGDVNQLYPAVGGDEDFDWHPFRELCPDLWFHFQKRIISLPSLPPMTLGLLAEFHQELAGLPAFKNLPTEGFNKSFSDGLFNLLVWNGVFTPLLRMFPVAYQKLINGFCTYVKAAWGMGTQTQGSIGQAVVAMVPDAHVRQCAEFCSALGNEVERLAGLRTVQFRDTQQNSQLNRLRESKIASHFTGTWLSRTDDYEKIVDNGNYYLTDARVGEIRCTSYKDFSEYVGTGSKNYFPQVILHVAGDRIKNFLSNTYLYAYEKPFFTDAKGQRVDPVPDLRTTFVLSRREDGRITVKFSCADDAVKLAMLVDNDDDGLQRDAIPLFQASLEFQGTFHFYPDGEEFEAGEISVKGQNFHMFQ